MNSNLNKNQNFGDNQFSISQAEKNDYNNLNPNPNIIKSISRKKEESQYIQKKRKKPYRREKGGI
jgi:hypothetical protein